MVLKISEHWVTFRTTPEHPAKPLTRKKRLKNSRPIEGPQLTLYKPECQQIYRWWRNANTLVL